MSGLLNKAARKACRCVVGRTPIYVMLRANALGNHSDECNVSGAREMLASISPKPRDPWPIAHVDERDPDVELSIIVPVYNEERYVGECIRSICASRTSFSFEVVVIDDGSSDGSGAICDDWAARDSRVRVIHQPNRGFSGARNAGLDSARGGVVMFVDSDDAVSETLVESLMVELRESGADVVTGGFTVTYEDGRPNREMSATKGRHGGPWSRVYRRASKWELRFPEGYWFEDTIVAYMVLQQRRCVMIGDNGYIRRMHSAQITATHKSSAKALDSYWIVECVLDRMRELGMPLSQDAYDQTLKQFGPLLFSRVGGVLGERDMRALFSACCDLLASATEFAGLSTTMGGKWADIELSLRNRNYALWRLACRYA